MKILPDVISDLRLDLVDTGALWTDAELIRCVKRAVADLSRFLPLERSYEVTVDADVSDSFTSPKDILSTEIVDAFNLENVVGGDASAIIRGQPDMPRPVRILITDTNLSISDFIIVVKGINTSNNYIEESFYFSGGLIQTGERYFSRVTQVEVRRISGNNTGDALSIGLGSFIDVWVELGAHPIKLNSELISGMVLDADYAMDYFNGKIALLSGGSMAAETSYDITYTKNKINIDISSLIDFIRVNRVEYPIGELPQAYPANELWGRTLTILGEAMAGQSEMTDTKHALVQYFAEHLAPAEYTPGSYPSFIEPTVEMAAAAYALFGKAVEYEHQAANDYAKARVALTAVAVLHTDIAELLESAEGLINDDDESAENILGRIYVDRIALREAIASGLLAATNALDSISVADATTYIEAAIASLGSIAASVTKVEAALTSGGNADVAASAVLGAHSFTDVETALSAAKAVLDAVLSTSIDKATTGAEAYLDTGDDKIISLNKAANVPDNYAGYSKARLEIAQARITTALGFLQEAAQRYDKLKTNNDTVTGYTYVSEDYSVIAEAHQGVITGLVRKAEQELVAASQVTYRERLKSEKATGHVSVVSARLSNLRTYIEQSAAYQNASNALTGEAQTKLAEIDRHFGQADRYSGIAEANMLLAQRFREDGAERRNEVWSIWRTPGDYKGSFVQHTTRQM